MTQTGQTHRTWWSGVILAVALALAVGGFLSYYQASHSTHTTTQHCYRVIVPMPAYNPDSLSGVGVLPVVRTVCN